MAQRVVSHDLGVSPTRFVGRKDELGLLRLVFDRVGAGAVHLVTITGEAGIGKGRLVGEFVSGLEADGIHVAALRGRCPRSGAGVSFRPLREIVEAQAGIEPGDGPDVVYAKVVASVQAAVADEADRDWVSARLAPLVGVNTGTRDLPQGVEQGEWFAAWRTYLEGLARVSGTLVLVIRDLQWAEPALLSFIEHLVDTSAGASIMIICLARPDLYDRSPQWGGGKRLSLALALSPLTETETAELLDALIQARDRPAPMNSTTEQELIERSGGIPLFAEQFMRLVDSRASEVGTGPSDAGEGAGRSPDHAGAEGSIPVPRSLRSLIDSRLAELSEERRRILVDASVLGRQFWAGAVAAIAERDEDEVRAALQELARRELIRPLRHAPTDLDRSAADQEFAFANGVIRDVAYGSIPPEELASKHATAAYWIEQAAPRLGDETDLLVRQFDRAVELALASPPEGRAGLDVERLVERAIHYLEATGDRAIGFDVGRARISYERALELSPPDHPHRLEVLTRLARAAWLMGDFEEARGRNEEVVAASSTRGDNAAAGEAMLDLAYALWNQGVTVRAREVLAEAIAVLERERGGEALARGYAMLAADRFLAGDSAEALLWCEKVLLLAEDLDLPERKERALEVRGMARCDLGDQGGLEDLHAALDMALDLGLGQEVVRAYINLGTFVLPVDGPAAALELYREAQAVAERRGLGGMSMWARGWAVGPLFELGRWDELLEAADVVVSWERSQGGLTQFGLAARLTQAEVLVLRGDVEPAAAMVGEFLPQAREIDDPQALIPALAVAALVSQARGEADPAVLRLEELENRRRAGGRWAGSLFLALCVRVLVWAGRADLAEGLLEDADQSSTRARHSLVSARATLAEAAGHHEDAADLYAEAAAGWDAFGFVLERALALAGEARCLAAVGRASEAADRRAAADALRSRLGMPPEAGPVEGAPTPLEVAPARDAGA